MGDGDCVWAGGAAGNLDVNHDESFEVTKTDIMNKNNSSGDAFDVASSSYVKIEIKKRLMRIFDSSVGYCEVSILPLLLYPGVVTERWFQLLCPSTGSRCGMLLLRLLMVISNVTPITIPIPIPMAIPIPSRISDQTCPQTCSISSPGMSSSSEIRLLSLTHGPTSDFQDVDLSTPIKSNKKNNDKNNVCNSNMKNDMSRDKNEDNGNDNLYYDSNRNHGNHDNYNDRNSTYNRNNDNDNVHSNRNGKMEILSPTNHRDNGHSNNLQNNDDIPFPSKHMKNTAYQLSSSPLPSPSISLPLTPAMTPVKFQSSSSSRDDDNKTNKNIGKREESENENSLILPLSPLTPTPLLRKRSYMSSPYPSTTTSPVPHDPSSSTLISLNDDIQITESYNASEISTPIKENFSSSDGLYPIARFNGNVDEINDMKSAYAASSSSCTGGIYNDNDRNNRNNKNGGSLSTESFNSKEHSSTPTSTEKSNITKTDSAGELNALRQRKTTIQNSLHDTLPSSRRSSYSVTSSHSTNADSRQRSRSRSMNKNSNSKFEKDKKRHGGGVAKNSKFKDDSKKNDDIPGTTIKEDDIKRSKDDEKSSLLAPVSLLGLGNWASHAASAAAGFFQKQLMDSDDVINYENENENSNFHDNINISNLSNTDKNNMTNLKSSSSDLKNVDTRIKEKMEGVGRIHVNLVSVFKSLVLDAAEGDHYVVHYCLYVCMSSMCVSTRVCVCVCLYAHTHVIIMRRVIVCTSDHQKIHIVSQIM